MQLPILGPKDNQYRQCLDSSMEILEGLVALARAPESEVVDMLTKREMSASQREMREEQARMWKERRAPQKLANYQYQWCVKQGVALGELGDRCFSVAMVPATISLLKTAANKPKEYALEIAIKTWGHQVSENWLHQIVDDVYAAETAEKKQVVFRQVFVNCLVTNNKN